VRTSRSRTACPNDCSVAVDGSDVRHEVDEDGWSGSVGGPGEGDRGEIGSV
jgi:hypothetical protein